MPVMKSPLSRWVTEGGYPLAFILISVWLAYLLPERWSRSVGPLRGLVKAVTATVPSVKHYSAVSLFPGTTETLLSLLWALSPLLVYLHLRMLNQPERSPTMRRPIQQRAEAYTLGYRIVLFAVAALLLSITVLFPLIGHPISDRALNGHNIGGLLLRSVSQSRFWLGLFAALSCWICSFGLALIWLALAHLFKRPNLKRD